MPFLTSDQLDYRKALPTKARASSQCWKQPAYSRITMTKDSKYHNDMPTGAMTGRVEAGWLPPWRPYLSDLWEELIVWSKRHHFEWVWIRQHERHRENERCDALARAIGELDRLDFFGCEAVKKKSGMLWGGWRRRGCIKIGYKIPAQIIFALRFPRQPPGMTEYWLGFFAFALKGAAVRYAEKVNLSRRAN